MKPNNWRFLPLNSQRGGLRVALPHPTLHEQTCPKFRLSERKQNLSQDIDVICFRPEESPKPFRGI
jgi:hypothetical protein